MGPLICSQPGSYRDTLEMKCNQATLCYGLNVRLSQIHMLKLKAKAGV